MGKLFAMFLPMLAVESGDRNFLDRRNLQAAHVDTVAVRIRSRNIKRFDAAHPAKQVLGDPRVKRIRRETFRPLKQNKPRFGNDEMKIAGPAANRAVAFRGLDFLRGFDFELHATTMATPRMNHEQSDNDLLNLILAYHGH